MVNRNKLSIKNILRNRQFFFVFSFIIIFFLTFPSEILARSGCCSWHGGVCGCKCCDGTPLSATCAPYYPECGGGRYTPPPTCPLHSYYDSISDSCKCYSGYVLSGSRCISQDEYCQNIYGFNSKYNILKDNCECKYGYVFDNSKCISGNQFCRNKYGYNSSYNSLSETCECRYGYVFNESGTKCISEDEACQEQFGFGAKATISGDKCECRPGYVWEGNNCVLDDFSDGVFDSREDYNIELLPSPTPSLKQKPVVTGATTEKLPTPSPTPTPTPTETPTPTPSPTISPTKDPEVKGITSQEKPTSTAGTVGTIGTMGVLSWSGYKFIKKILSKKS